LLPGLNRSPEIRSWFQPVNPDLWKLNNRVQPVQIIKNLKCKIKNWFLRDLCVFACEF
jgi:hypothetical protein